MTTSAKWLRETERPVALLTGASAGIGRVFAQWLASQGHDWILVARDGVRLQALADELALQRGVDAEAVPADLARDDGMRRVAERITQMDRLAFLVNNAGFGTKGLLVNRPVAAQATMLKLHVMTAMILTRAALPGMIARGKGTIVNVSSVASFAYSMGSPPAHPGPPPRRRAPPSRTRRPRPVRTARPA